MKRIVSAVLLGAVASLTLLLAPPAYAQGCAASQVTVVVQFPDRTAIGCATNPDSGYQALQKAGFKLSFARGNGAGAICGIDGFPRTECSAMPPADAYWAYFRGKPGQGWEYSKIGGGSSNPQPGTVEGWRFQDTSSTQVPSTPPPANAAPEPTKAPSAKPTRSPAAPTTRAPAVPGAPDSSAPATGTPSASTSPSADASTASPDASADPTASTPGTASTAVPTDGLISGATPTSASSPAEEKSSGGVSWIWGVLLLAGLAGAGGFVVVRRKG